MKPKTSIAPLVLLLLTACTSHSQKPVTNTQPASPATKECSRHYLFEGTYYDLETYQPAEIGGFPVDFKKCSKFHHQFDQTATDTVVYKGKTFFVNKDSHELVITSPGETKPLTVKTPLINPKEEVFQYYFTLITTFDGVVLIMEDYYGTTFTITKYDEKGKELVRTELEHTFVTHPQPNENYHHRYLYLGYTTPTELIFTSHVHFAEKDKTIVLQLKDLSKKEYEYKLSGIVMDEEQQYAKGFIAQKDNVFTMDFPSEGKQSTFTIENADNACTTILNGDKIIVANYHTNATGSALYCFDVNTGQQVWKADVKQVMASHSEYYNTVYLSRYKNTIVMEGRESYGNYLQFFDVETGKRLGVYGIPEFNRGDK